MIVVKNLFAELKQRSDFIFEKGRLEYVGCRNKRGPYTHPFVNKLLNVWYGQKDRCNNKKLVSYKTYGKRGVKRIWSFREFTSWYFKELSKRECWERPDCSRVNDIGNYEIGNCKLIEHKENASETPVTDKKRNHCKKLGKWAYKLAAAAKCKKVVIFNKTNSIEFPSASELGRKVGLKHPSSISVYIRGHKRVKLNNKKYYVRYL